MNASRDLRKKVKGQTEMKMYSKSSLHNNNSIEFKGRLTPKPQLLIQDLSKSNSKCTSKPLYISKNKTEKINNLSVISNMMNKQSFQSSRRNTNIVPNFFSQTIVDKNSELSDIIESLNRANRELEKEIKKVSLSNQNIQNQVSVEHPKVIQMANELSSFKNQYKEISINYLKLSDENKYIKKHLNKITNEINTIKELSSKEISKDKVQIHLVNLSSFRMH